MYAGAFVLYEGGLDTMDGATVDGAAVDGFVFSWTEAVGG